MNCERKAGKGKCYKRQREESKSLLLPTVSAEGMCVRKWILHLFMIQTRGDAA